MYKVSVVSTNDIYYDLGSDGHIYKMVEESLFLLGLDKDNYGKQTWNPLGKYIRPRNSVVIKPNLVLHKNYRKGYEDDIECVFTQPEVVKPIIDYTIKALNGEGKIIVGDAPVQECDFEELIEKSGYRELIDEYKGKGVDISLKDFRGVRSVSDYGVLHQSINENAEYCIVKLGKESEFNGVSDRVLKRIRITNYNPDELLKHHNENIHEYCVAKDILEADVIINMPKPKTHRKAGMTACLKNLVGINCRKEYLPHHTIGASSESGDEYKAKSKFKQCRTRNHDMFCKCVYEEKYIKARFYQVLVILQDMTVKYFYKDKTSFGSWSGNTTISKTTIDLNKILLYADKTGIIRKEKQRQLFNVCDMIISGEKNGPMAPTSKKVGLIISGENSYSIDMIISKMMGINVELLPTLKCAKEISGNIKICDIDEHIVIYSNDNKYDKADINDLTGCIRYNAPEGWEDVFVN